ncbi:MAG TPA: manganese efflux pump [Candidatus Cybelea sp.]|jgi:putative Mn2+ efflux pump MntP|nr:manganese efflux pump [Candidatus Cybelea sp.]
MAAAFLKVFVIAVVLALDVFAVSVGVGVRGVRAERRWRIGLAFACAEVTMNVVGAGLGLIATRLIGDAAAYVGFAALAGLGIYMIREGTNAASRSQLDLSRGPGLLMASLAISLDSLGIGYTILYVGVPMPVSLIVIAIVSVASTMLGLMLGRRLGRYAERNATLAGGVLLALTGILFAALKALHVG